MKHVKVVIVKEKSVLEETQKNGKSIPTQSGGSR